MRPEEAAAPKREIRPVSINVSDHSLQQRAQVNQILGQLAEPSAPISLIQVEVLEVVLVGRSANPIADIRSCLERGQPGTHPTSRD